VNPLSSGLSWTQALVSPLTLILAAFYGILFPNHLIAAYSNFRLWESTGSVIGYVISSQLCTSTKLLILMGVMCVGCVG